MHKDKLIITNKEGKSIGITLQPEAQRQVGALQIDGVLYHIEKMPAREFRAKYTVDVDKEYEPQTDADDCCVIIAPFLK
ncbi:MAG: hypothetical protein JW944_13705 [Deltaproteobacteria bacterium]|nr:hypothetical protein [Deltaproteobacteria bacterium]